MRIVEATDTGVMIELDPRDLALLAHACDHAANPMDPEPYAYQELETAGTLFQSWEMIVRMRGASHATERERFTFANLRAGLVDLRVWKSRETVAS